MSDADFNEILSQINDFSIKQKKSLMKALKKSLSPFSKKTADDMHLTESLIGAAGSEDMTFSQIKDERLSAL